jgi:uncharacterized protein YdeI (YjbR/CyaY-like superfamily)
VSSWVQHEYARNSGEPLEAPARIPEVEPKFFRSAAHFRKWLERNHATCKELIVGFYKKDSGKPSITYPEARDQALCFGWIDGVRNALDEISYTNRFSPRKPKSVWSAVNIARVRELTGLGLMTAAGLKVFESREEHRSRQYSFENKPKQFPPEYDKQLRANKKASKYFDAQPPWYRRTSTFWVLSAKKEETRQKRFHELISDSEKQQWIKPLRRAQKQKGTAAAVPSKA